MDCAASRGHQHLPDGARRAQRKNASNETECQARIKGGGELIRDIQPFSLMMYARWFIKAARERACVHRLRMRCWHLFRGDGGFFLEENEWHSPNAYRDLCKQLRKHRQRAPDLGPPSEASQ